MALLFCEMFLNGTWSGDSKLFEKLNGASWSPKRVIIKNAMAPIIHAPCLRCITSKKHKFSHMLFWVIRDLPLMYVMKHILYIAFLGRLSLIVTLFENRLTGSNGKFWLDQILRFMNIEYNYMLTSFGPSGVNNMNRWNQRICKVSLNTNWQ